MKIDFETLAITILFFLILGVALGYMLGYNDGQLDAAKGKQIYQAVTNNSVEWIKIK